LEIDHNVPISEGGPTALWNLRRLCAHHHEYKHARNLRLEGKGTRQRFVPRGPPPEGPAPPPGSSRSSERFSPVATARRGTTSRGSTPSSRASPPASRLRPAWPRERASRSRGW
jgi:hypothetical protein